MKFSLIKKITFLLLAVFLISGPSYAQDYKANAVERYNQAIDYTNEGDYKSAITSLKKAIVIEPEFTDAYYNLGSIYEYLGEYDKAIVAFKQLLAKNVQDDEAAYKIASLYYKKGSYKSALNFVHLVPAKSSKFKETQALYHKIVAKINEDNLTEKQKMQTEENKLQGVDKKPAMQAQAAKVQTQPVAKKVSISNELSQPTKMVYKNFNGPTGVAKDSLGNVYVANYSNNTIQKITPGNQKAIVAQGGLLNGPLGLAIDSYNNLFVANYLSNQVLKVSADGNVSVLLNNIKKPYFLFVDKSNNLYVSEQGSNSVIKVRIYK